MSCCILIKDAPIICSISENDVWPATAAIETRPEKSLVCVSLQSDNVVPESFTRKVIYSRNWIVVTAGRCLVHLAEGRGRTDTCTWWMPCFLLSSLSLLETSSQLRQFSFLTEGCLPFGRSVVQSSAHPNINVSLTRLWTTHSRWYVHWCVTPFIKCTYGIWITKLMFVW